MALLDEYYNKQKKNLEELYGKQQANLTAEKQSQLQQAAITQRLREKYLPNQLSAYGIGNTGMAQSAYLDLQNLYGTQRGNIGQAYQTALSGLESNYMTNLSNLEREQYQTQLAQQQQLYNDLSQYIAMAETKKQAETLLERYKDSLSELQHRMLEDQIGLQGYMDSAEGFETWIGSTSNLTNKKGANFGVTIDGSTFSKLELGSDAPQSVVNAVKTKIDSGNLPENTLFVSSLDDNVYIVLSGGTIKRVGGQGGLFKVDYEGKGAGYRDYTNLKELLKRRGQVI
jgi:hypothetical protein